MRKIDSLREAIFAALPELKRDPDRLRIWIDRGSAKSTQTEDQGLVFVFRLNVLVVEMASDIAILGLAVFRWMRANQPELMVPGAEGFDFDADVLDNGIADVLLQLQLDQVVSARRRPDGGFDLQYQEEPDPLLEGAIMSADPPPLLTGHTVEEDLPPWDV